MSSIAGSEVTDKLNERDQSLVFRTRQRPGQPPGILEFLKQSYPTPQELIRLWQAFTTTRALESDGVIKVDGLKNHRNKKGHRMSRDWARGVARSSALSAVLFLCVTVVPVSAQNRSQPASTQNISQRRELDLPFDRYHWQSWTTQDGLPQNSVSDIVQTRDGYLWLATFGGLARFDGVRFKIFDLSNTDALPSNRILSLLEDRSGNLWIGTLGGGVVRLRDGVFTSYSGQENAPSGNVWSIMEDREGVIWFGARNLVRYAGGRFESFGPDEWMTGVKQVYSLLVDREQGLWVATDNGLGRFRDGQWRVFRVADGLARDGVQFVYEDSRGLLCASTVDRLHYLEGGKFVEVLPLGEQPGWIFATTVDKDGNNFVGSGKGLFLQRAMPESGNDSSDRIHFERSIERSVTENVRALLEDREGNLWVGTDGLGLLRLRAAAFTSIPLPPGENITLSVQSLADDGAGGLWIHYSGKIGHLKDDEWNVLSVDNDIRAIGGIWAGSDGTLWIKHHQGRRLSKYQDGRFIHVEQDFHRIESVLVDRQGTVWISSADGLSTIRNGQIKTITVADGLPSIGGKGLLADSRDGTIWIGGNGTLNRYRNGEFDQYSSADGFPSGEIRSIYEVRDGNLWIATYGGGMARLRDGKFTRYTTDEGLPDNSLGKILEDDAGNLWINSNRGVFRVSLDELNGFADGRLSKINCRTFGTGEARGRGGMRTTDGRLWFPTIDGLITIEPERVATNEVPPPIVIEAIHVSDQSFGRADRLELPMDRRDVVIEYTALSFVDPDDVTFRYRLIGYDEDWVDAGAKRRAEYKRIPPGTYEFQVQARNNDFVWSEHAATLGLSVPAHFYETTWFYVACSLGVIMIGFVGLRARTRNMRTRNASLRESEERLRLTLDAVKDGGWDWNVETGEVRFSDRWIESLGYTRDEVEPHFRFWKGIVHPDDWPTVRGSLDAHLEGRNPYYVCENRMRTKSGDYRWNLDRGKVVARRADGTPLRMVGTTTDISDRKRAEEARHRFDHIVSSSTDMLALLDRDFTYLAANEAYLKAFGRKYEEVIGRTVAEIFGEEFFESIIRPQAERCLAGIEVHYQKWFEFPVSGRQHMDIAYFPYVDANEAIKGFVVCGRNTTESKRAEEAVLEKEKQLDNLLSNVGVIVLEGDPLDIYYVGGQVERILGYPKELWFEDPDGPVGFWSKHLHPDDTYKIEICRRAIEQGNDHAFEYRMIAADGREVWFYDTITVESENGKPVKTRSVMVDITERKRTEEALRESEERFELAFRGSGVGLWDWDVVTGRLFWSPRMFEQLGYEPDEFNPTFETFRDIVHPEDLRGLEDAIRAHHERREPYFFECRLRAKSGEYRWFRTAGEATWNDDGTAVRMVGTSEDITDRKHAAEVHRKLENQLRQAQKMEAVGQLAGGVSHDIRNVLTAILAYADLARVHRQDESMLLEMLEGVVTAANEASEMTKALLTIGRQESSEKAPVDLGSLVEESIRMLRRMLPAAIHIETEIPPDARLTVWGNATQLRQIIVNLALNARDAMSHGGRLRVGIREHTTSDMPSAVEVDANQRHRVRLEVEDSGIGMSQEVLARAFEPFFTTKPRGKGTGLGLAMVHGITGDHNGKIDIDSVVGRGTRVSIEFPRHEPALDEPAATVARECPPSGHGETLLLIEDYDAIRTSLAELLSDVGYTVLQASDGIEGIEVFTAHVDIIKLLILDVDLPKMDGVSVLKTVRRSAPEMPAVIMTGGDIERVRELVDGAVEVIQKPVRLTELLEVFSRLLAADAVSEEKTIHSPRPG